jgi:curved DNA-binding protein CbpA
MIRKNLVLRVFSQYKNYYEVLGLPLGSSFDQIKQSYLNLAKKYHPDSPEGNEEIFKLVSEAYQVLKTEEKKTEYDESLKKLKKNTKDTQNATHSSHKDHKKYESVFRSNSWSGGMFTKASKEEKSKEDIKPTDVLIKMGFYSITSAGISIIIYILFLLFKPIEEKPKIPKASNLETKKPERFPARSYN